MVKTREELEREVGSKISPNTLGIVIGLVSLYWIVLFLFVIFPNCDKLETQLSECQENFCKQEKVFVYDKYVEDRRTIPCDEFTKNVSNEANYIRGHFEDIYDCEIIE